MKFLIDGKDIKKVTDFKGSCIVSNQITQKGKKVGYMYREQPTNKTDSGWRFFSGAESQKYCDNAKNFNILDVNTLCNYDTSVIEKLSVPFGTAFVKNDKGEFVEEKLEK